MLFAKSIYFLVKLLQGVYSEVISITQVGVNKNDIADASSVQQIQSEMNRALYCV